MRRIILTAAAAMAIGPMGVSGVSAVPMNATAISAEAGADALMKIGYYYYRNGHRYYYSGRGRRSCPDWKRDSGLC
jgi:hypothetical protein